MPRTQPRADRARSLSTDALAAFLADAQARFKPRPLLAQLLDAVPDTVDTSCPPCGRVWARPLGADLECPTCSVGEVADLRYELGAARESQNDAERELARLQQAYDDLEAAARRDRETACENEARLEDEYEVKRRRVVALEALLDAAGISHAE